MVFGTIRNSSRSWRSTGNREPLHDEPEFQPMVAEIEADLAEQRARVREMERNGEFEPIPEISTTAHRVPTAPTQY